MAVPHRVKEKSMADETKETAASKETPKKKAAAKKKAASKKKTGAKRSTGRKTAKKKKTAAGPQGNGQKVNKTEFILSFSEDVKPQEIAEKAKAQGLTVDPSYASTVRSKAKSAGTWPPKGANGTRTSVRSTAPGVGAEGEFRRAARAITLDRAQEILNEIAAAYEG